MAAPRPSYGKLDELDPRPGRGTERVEEPQPECPESHPRKTSENVWSYLVIFSWHYDRGQRRLPINPEKREFSGKEQSICGPLIFPIILYFIIYIIYVNVCFSIYYRY